MFQPSSRAGLLALIGPNRDMEPDELMSAFGAFYGAMFRTGNGNAAYTAMNDAVHPTKPTFAHGHRAGHGPVDPTSRPISIVAASAGQTLSVS
jgi:hypothetical protein